MQLPLGGRICEVTDVESSSLVGAGQDSFAVSIVLARGFRLVRDGCVAKGGSNVVDGVSNFLHDCRHDD